MQTRQPINITESTSTTVEQWVQANAVLPSAVSCFLDLSILLEKECTGSYGDSNYLVTLIDSSLDALQTTIDQQLACARVALAKTRNRLASLCTILSFPREILSEIFMNVVYDSPDRDQPLVMNMADRVKTIYSRLHSLLGVCTIWRDIVLSCGALWSVVPVVDPFSGQLRSQSTELSLRRAGGGKELYLAISLAQDNYRRANSLRGHFSRFSSINIHHTIYSDVSLSTLLMMILEDDAPRALSKLFLRYSGKRAARATVAPTGPLDDWFVNSEPQIIQLVRSLSALRLHAVALNWENLAFSNRLVTLQIGGISIGSQPGINHFISALASATELRELALISLEAVPDRSENILADILALPKLELLHLEGLEYHVQSLFIGIITPKSYRLTVNLYPGTSGGFFLSEGTLIRPEDAPKDEICARLKRARIAKLVLNWEQDSAWGSAADLHALLQSVPTVKTLVLNFYDLNQDTLRALNPTPRSPLEEHTSDNNFPQLENVEIHCCTIKCPLSELRTGLQDLLANHPIKRLVLGRYFDDDNVIQFGSSLEDEEVIEWLETTVPYFRWFPLQTGAPEMIDVWQLWDI